MPVHSCNPAVDMFITASPARLLSAAYNECVEEIVSYFRVFNNLTNQITLSIVLKIM
jgi:hypothetical protein